MSCRCASCVYRTSDMAQMRKRPGCSYLLVTGHSRLAAVYKRLGEKRMTKRVHEAMRPENCLCYRRGAKIILPDEGQILLPGSAPLQRRFNRELAREFYDRGLNDRQIADELGCAFETVRRWRKSEGLPHNYQQGKREASG